MNKLLDIQTITEYNEYMGVETVHPLISIIDFSKVRKCHRYRTILGFYAMFFKDSACGELHYGLGKYDYTDGTLVCIGPQQLFNFDAKGEEFQPRGIGLLFHPDLIQGTELGRNMRQYSFFSYEMNEALHLSSEERAVLDDCIRKIRTELSHTVDRFTRKLIVSNLEMLLDYCLRFFDRQFDTRRPVNKDILVRFESFLNDYLHSPKVKIDGLPTVGMCADAVNLSPNYFSDLVRKETGKPALDFIHAMVMSQAKEMIYDERLTFSEIAYRLGFRYPQHFTRFFKRMSGMTPNQYRESLAL